MNLAPREQTKLMLHQAGELAQKRYARGLLLNYPETVALLSSVLLERIRDGASVAFLMDEGKRILGFDEVMPGVADMLTELHVEGTFFDGTKLLTIHQPICRPLGDAELALYASGQSKSTSAIEARIGAVKPGEIFLAPEPVVINQGRDTLSLLVTNLGDRPVQVGSHYPFFEVNPELRFDRRLSYGYRLNIPAGTAVRFEPGDTREVELVALAGRRIVRGGNGLCDGPLTSENLEMAMQRVQQRGFSHLEQTEGKS